MTRNAPAQPESRDAQARITLATPPRMAVAAVAAALPAALDAGVVACVRLDLPGASETELRAAVDLLAPICHQRDTALVIADHFRLVGPLGLDGVEVDGAHVRLREAREAIGADQILGVRCGASRHAGLSAAEAGADYVLFGPVAGDAALGDGSRAPRDLFAWWSEVVETPVVAEGGVDPALALDLAPVVDFIIPDATIWGPDNRDNRDNPGNRDGAALADRLRALDAALREGGAPAVLAGG